MSQAILDFLEANLNEFQKAELRQIMDAEEKARRREQRKYMARMRALVDQHPGLEDWLPAVK